MDDDADIDYTRFLSKAQHKEAKQAARETVGATNRMLRQIDESQRVGTETLQRLGQQSRQLQRTQNKMDENAFNIDRAQDLSKGLEGLTRKTARGTKAVVTAPGKAAFMLHRKIQRRRADGTLEEVEVGEGDVVADREEPLEPERDLGDAWDSIAEQSQRLELFGKEPVNLPKDTGARNTGIDRRYFAVSVQHDLDETDRNLDAISAHLKNLRGIAEAAGDEVRKQSTMLDSLDSDVDRQGTKLKNVRQRIGKKIKAVE